MKPVVAFTLITLLTGCLPHDPTLDRRIVPAEEFARSIKEGRADDFSIFRAVQEHEKGMTNPTPGMSRASMKTPDETVAEAAAPFQGDPRYLEQGYALRRSVGAPKTDFVSDGDVAGGGTPNDTYRQLPRPPQLPPLPPGSQSPYSNGQMTHNPSLWPDEAQGANLFTDFRAFQPMDVITVVVNESTVGRKKTESSAEGSYSILAGITELFGIETKSWASNNESLDPATLISASTENKFEGEGELKREGSLKTQLSAVIMEILPNGIMRVEGTKIVAVDGEEETVVISGLVRMRDVNSENQVDSNRVANMRVDFYGRGILGEQQQPGWGARLIEKIWPF